MKSYQIHFIRHGITDGNIKGQYIGSTDLPLCEQGREQLRELERTMDYPGAAALLTSPMKRCVESAAILYPELHPIEIQELRECDFGYIEGMTVDDMLDSKNFGPWMAADKDFAPFGGESGEHFSQRICGGFEQIVSGLMKTGTTSTIIMTHGGVISTLLSRYGLPRAMPTDWTSAPGCGYSVRIHPQLWLSGQVFEVYARIPQPKQPDEDGDE